MSLLSANIPVFSYEQLAGGGSSTPAWTPASLSNLSFWMDANNLLPGTCNSFVDLSPQAQLYTQQGLGATIVPNIKNGKNGLWFNGVTSYFMGGTNLILPENGGGGWGWWGVLQGISFSQSVQSIGIFCSGVVGIGQNNEFFISNLSGQYNDLSWGTGQATPPRVVLTSSPIGNVHRVAISYNGGADNPSGYFATDGNTTVTPTGNAGTGGAAATNIIGGGAFLGLSDNFFFNGYLFEIVCKSTAFTVSDLNNLATYGSTKWGV